MQSIYWLREERVFTFLFDPVFCLERGRPRFLGDGTNELERCIGTSTFATTTEADELESGPSSSSWILLTMPEEPELTPSFSS